MTSTLAQGVGRRPGEPAGPLPALALSPALVLLLLAGAAVRLTIAYVLFPASGFESDVATYGAWAAAMAEHGPAGFYANVSFADYPPAYLYVLWLLGLVAEGGAPVGELVKLPPMLVDVVIAYVIYRLVRGWTWPAPGGEGLALAAAALYLFNPVSFYDSALWGQTDAVGALVVLLGLAALIRGNSEGAAALAVLAALVKPQFGVVLIPLVALVLLKRHLVRPGSGPQRQPWAPAPVAAWLLREQGPLRLLTAALAGAVVFFVLALPFGMGPLEYLERMFSTAGGYGYLTVNAFNLWALVAPEGAPTLASGLHWNDDSVPLLGPLPAVVVGAGLLAAGFLWGTLRAAARDDRWTLLVAATFLAAAFFILPTRVHERYIFPVIALLPLLAVVGRRWLIALLLLSAGAFINLHAILTLPLYGTANVETLPGGELFRREPLVVLSALLQTGVGLWLAWQLRPTLRTSPDGFDEARAGGRGPSLVEARGVESGRPGRAGPGLTAPTGPAAAGPSAERFAGPDLPVGVGVAWASTRSLLDRVVARLSWGSLRRDRSASLALEPGGRLDRRDLLIVTALVLLTLLMRGFRLDQPARMYFDEVYHARTALEFLQHWEYGQPHAIYEFTHPHLAKYAMALGVRHAGGNRVVDERELGGAIADAALEPGWEPPDRPGRRTGDRLYVAGEGLRVYDLASEALVTSLPIEATAVAVDQERHRVFVADENGALDRLDSTRLEEFRGALRDDATGAAVQFDPSSLEPFAEGPGAGVRQLLVTDTSVVAITPSAIASYEPEIGTPLAERPEPGIADALELPWADRLVVDTRQLPDRDAAAARIADALAGGNGVGDLDGIDRGPPGGDASERERVAELLARDGLVVIDAYLGEGIADTLGGLIEEGLLPGASIEQGPLLALATGSGISIVDARTLDPIDHIGTDGPVEGLALIDPGADEPRLYGATGSSLLIVPITGEGPGFDELMWMPGPVSMPVWNASAELVHVLGETPAGAPTVYVVEPKGQSVFADVPLSQRPLELLADARPDDPAADRAELLAVADDGRLTTIDIGGNGFGWRLPGVLFGVLGGALLYLLARVLFARRSVALIVGALVVAEGMLFANSRIAMNDVYVTTFLVLAALLVAPLYLAPRRASVSLALVVGAGLALGLALASKWVALYAIGGMGLLVLLRSTAGRFIALVVMIGLTAVLGAMAIRPAPVTDPTLNWAFLLLMVVLTGALAAGIVRRPIVDAAGTSEWLRPGRHVLPWLVTLGSLTLLPLAVYIVSYAPWVALGNQWGLPLLDAVPVLPASTDGGQTLVDLTESMYQYHDNLRAEHAASSPWWAWPLDLKPVWFFSERYADGTTGLIYDSGNLVIFWMGIAGMAFSAWAAWRRRSLSLALVVIMWAALWLPWARIDRATFQYHVYASLPFLLLALAYFLAELWHGPAARTWFLARTAAALAILGAPLLWLLRTPMCILAGTAVAHPDGVACAAALTRGARLSPASVVAIVSLAVGAGLAGYLLWRAGRAPARGDGGGDARGWMVALAGVGLVTAVAVMGSLLLLDSGTLAEVELSSDVLAAPAWLVLRARDPRRFVVGVLAAALVWLVVFYPNIAGLPLPADVAGVYQALLPTWNWDFQFAVNTDAASDSGIFGPATLVVALVTLVSVIVVAAAAWAWGRARTGA